MRQLQLQLLPGWHLLVAKDDENSIIHRDHLSGNESTPSIQIVHLTDDQTIH